MFQLAWRSGTGFVCQLGGMVGNNSDAHEDVAPRQQYWVQGQVQQGSL